MTVKNNHAARRCDIWVAHGERETYAQSPEYRVCVFVGGEAPLLPGVAALLDRQQPGFF